MRDSKTHGLECSQCSNILGGEDHYGGNHTNGGKCTICDYPYMKDEIHNWVTDTSYGRNGFEPDGYFKHTVGLKCSIKDCNATKIGSDICNGYIEDHEFGKCKDCGQVIKEHTTMILPVPLIGVNQHRLVVKCDMIRM